MISRITDLLMRSADLIKIMCILVMLNHDDTHQLMYCHCRILRDIFYKQEIKVLDKKNLSLLNKTSQSDQRSDSKLHVL